MFEEWFVKYDRMIHHLLHQYHITYDREDYYQLALIRLWRIAENYDCLKTPNESQYVYLQLKFCLIDEIRKRMTYQERFLLMTDETLPEVEILEPDLLCFDNLTKDELEWLNYTHQGFRLAEIADKMTLTVSQVKYIRKKARIKLQENNDLPFQNQS
ncbi:sigma-70 family RNA polymerase sigma factor [Macrococcus brunensis]|uniref:sigma-70 family RNA polymerase sigma factor n=1 Tax=Macrococcus brunensis TaxID=198483 RepID=UPI001EEFA746|nr:sigma-70 family RNA polymerase sigma factor [Macrococcus brunensis]ULG72674.1 sigma-70 family RNA polymerase sigma factor [Macrococcus brunensis]